MTYKFVRVSELIECSQDIIDIINLENKKQVFDNLNDKKLTDNTLMAIIDLIPLTKIDDVG